MCFTIIKLRRRKSQRTQLRKIGRRYKISVAHTQTSRLGLGVIHTYPIIIKSHWDLKLFSSAHHRRLQLFYFIFFASLLHVHVILFCLVLTNRGPGTQDSGPAPCSEMMDNILVTLSLESTEHYVDCKNST